MNEITVEELRLKMDRGEQLHLVDVREPYEHDQFNIGGTLIPVGSIRNLDVDELDPLKEEELILYCRSGGRSGQACQILESLGYAHTFNLIGGMLAWEQKYGTGT